jgi:hypothetical protein
MPVERSADTWSYWSRNSELLIDFLGAGRNRALTEAELIAVGRILYGSSKHLAMYGVPALLMETAGLRILARTAVEGMVDVYCKAVVDLVRRSVVAATGALGQLMVVDLFCGSGNIGFHLERELNAEVYASELDPYVYTTTRRNLGQVNCGIALRNVNYRELLNDVTPRGSRDIYVVDPPWNEGISERGLDFDTTSPPLPEILAAIRNSRSGRPCIVIIKACPKLAKDSLARAVGNAEQLSCITSVPTLPSTAASPHFYVYTLPP